MNSKAIAERLFLLYKAETQDDLAVKLGISQDLVSKWNRNKAMPRLEFLETIIKEKKCSWNWLLYGIDEFGRGMSEAREELIMERLNMQSYDGDHIPKEEVVSLLEDIETMLEEQESEYGNTIDSLETQAIQNKGIEENIDITKLTEAQQIAVIQGKRMIELGRQVIQEAIDYPEKAELVLDDIVQASFAKNAQNQGKTG
jgi:transcriptional regulator with XRE-family HTH domain